MILFLELDQGTIYQKVGKREWMVMAVQFISTKLTEQHNGKGLQSKLKLNSMYHNGYSKTYLNRTIIKHYTVKSD